MNPADWLARARQLLGRTSRPVGEWSPTSNDTTSLLLVALVVGTSTLFFEACSLAMARGSVALGAPVMLHAFGAQLAVALAALVSGGFFGFLLGIPKTATGNGEVPALPSPASRRRATFLTNTSLEQLSDWLTKTIVGVTLTEIRDIPAALVRLAAYASFVVDPSAAGQPFVLAFMIYFAVVGFFASYLATRFWLTEKLDSLERRLSGDAAETVTRAERSPDSPGSAGEIQAAQEIRRLVRPSELTHAEDIVVYAQACLIVGTADALTDALAVLTEALRAEPDDAKLRFQRGAVLARKREFERANADLDLAKLNIGDSATPEARRDIYQWLSYVNLYRPEKRGYEKVLMLYEEYFARAGSLPSPSMAVDRVCALAQKYSRQLGEIGPDAAATVRQQALTAVRDAVADSSSKARLAQMMSAAPGDDDDDLAPFATDPEFVALIK
jgi:hypothetical protein